MMGLRRSSEGKRAFRSGGRQPAPRTFLGSSGEKREGVLNASVTLISVLR